ncbi:MAG: glycoside hydrolase family 125 protein [Coprobacillaceae bacterium]
MKTVELAKKDLEKYIESVYSAIEDEHKESFVKCFKNTLHTTIEYDEENGITEILTGDIPAMWNRDSAVQIRPFLTIVNESPAMQELFRGLIKNYTEQIDLDPYANAFKVSSCTEEGHTDDLTDIKNGVWERKFEIDSLCYPIQIAYLYYVNSNDASVFNDEFLKMMKQIISVYKIEQNHDDSDYRFKRVNDWLMFEHPEKIKYETLRNNGLGTPVKPCGLIWSGFRPSDDACQLHYLIPSNQFAVVTMRYMQEILNKFYPQEAEFKQEVNSLATIVDEAIQNYAVIETENFGKVYAYEVDGLGNNLLMDDANVPSLLALPYLGYCSESDEVYTNTRKLILSVENEFYYSGKFGDGIGSPHTSENYAWHISNGIRGLSTSNSSEINRCLQMYLDTDCGCGMFHEGYNVDNPKEYTREWFSWSNSIYVELVLKKAGIEVKNGTL